MAHEAGQRPAQHITEKPAEEPSDESEDEHLREECQRDLRPARPKAPEYARVPPPAHHGEHGRVVDEEDADKKRYERKGLKIEPKSVQHAFVHPFLLPDGLNPESLPVPKEEIRLLPEDQVYSIDLPFQIEKPLGMTDIHEDHRFRRWAGKGTYEPKVPP